MMEELQKAIDENMDGGEVEVDNDIPEKVLLSVVEGSIVELWALFSLLEGNGAFERLKRKVKYGFSMNFDIRYVIKEDYKEYPENKIVEIGRRRGNLERFWDELEMRENAMREVIMNMIGNRQFKD